MLGFGILLIILGVILLGLNRHLWDDEDIKGLSFSFILFGTIISTLGLIW